MVHADMCEKGRLVRALDTGQAVVVIIVLFVAWLWACKALLLASD